MIQPLKIVLPIRFKAPGAEKLFRLNLTKYLNGDTIAAVTDVTISPTGLTVLDRSNTLTTITVKLGGGVLGTEYLVTAKFTRGDGEKDERSFYVQVAQT